MNLDSTADGYRFVRVSPNFAATEGEKKGPLLKFIGTRPTYDQNRFVPLEVKRGTLLADVKLIFFYIGNNLSDYQCLGSMVLIDGKAVHKSEPNTSNESRHAYTFHVADLSPETEWNELNW